jgi:hypothetical protein
VVDRSVPKYELVTGNAFPQGQLRLNLIRRRGLDRIIEHSNQPKRVNSWAVDYSINF